LAERGEPADRTRAISYAQLERLWRPSDLAVREKALWRLLYETAARASEVLSLDVGDVVLETAGRSCAARAATSSCCISRPDPHGCCHA
jgi:integrase